MCANYIDLVCVYVCVYVVSWAYLSLFVPPSLFTTLYIDIDESKFKNYWEQTYVREYPFSQSIRIRWNTMSMYGFVRQNMNDSDFRSACFFHNTTDVIIAYLVISYICTYISNAYSNKCVLLSLSLCVLFYSIAKISHKKSICLLFFIKIDFVVK